MTPQIKQQCHYVLAHCFKRASAYFARSFDCPDLVFTQRGKIAGTAHLQINQIRLNKVLLQHNLKPFVTQVIPHEAAHIIAFQRYGRVKPHGPEWQGIMLQVLAVKPQVTHQFDTSLTQGKTFPYRCGCGPVELSIRRHNKVLRKQQQYQCRRCKQPLTAALRTNVG